jgi:type IV pilus assembly protein PilE
MLKNKGFTLIEMIVVVLLIGILATMGVPAYINAVEDARGSEGLRTLQSMYSAAYDFYADNETFTGITLAQLNTYTGSNFADNGDWTYAVGNLGDGTFTFTATRQDGTGRTLVVNQDNDWTASTYPIP